MNVKYIGINHRSGKSRKSGKPYSICEVAYAIPFQAKTTDDYEFVGHGSEVRTMQASPDCLADFDGFEFGQEISLSFEPRPDNPTRNWVTGAS